MNHLPTGQVGSGDFQCRVAAVGWLPAVVASTGPSAVSAHIAQSMPGSIIRVVYFLWEYDQFVLARTC